MRIALLAPLRPPPAEPLGGVAERHVRLLAEGLAARGHDVTLYARPGGAPARGYGVRAYDPALAPAVDGLDAAEAASLRLRDAYGAVCDRVAAGRYDAVHDGTLHVVPWLRAGDLGPRLVHAVHGPPAAEFAACARAIRRPDRGRCAAVSRAVGDAWSLLAAEVEVVPVGIRLDRWRYSSRPVPGLCVFVGRIARDKGVHLALDAARVAGRQMVVAGPIPLDDDGYFDDEVRPRLDRERRYVGDLDALATSQLVSNAECLVYASAETATAGFVPAASLACGTPVVAYDSPPIRETLDDLTGVLVPRGDAEALGTAIARAVTLERRHCRRRAAERFALERMVDAYERIYSGLGARPPRGVHVLARAGGRGRAFASTAG